MPLLSAVFRVALVRLSADPKLGAKSWLKLGDWQRALLETHNLGENKISLILISLQKATELNPSSYKVWHAWAMINFEAEGHYHDVKYVVPAVRCARPTRTRTPDPRPHPEPEPAPEPGPVLYPEPHLNPEPDPDPEPDPGPDPDPDPDPDPTAHVHTAAASCARLPSGVTVHCKTRCGCSQCGSSTVRALK
jgi:hypothetical protein